MAKLQLLIQIISVNMVNILQLCKGFRDGGSSGTAKQSYCNIDLNITNIPCFIFRSLKKKSFINRLNYVYDFGGLRYFGCQSFSNVTARTFYRPTGRQKRMKQKQILIKP